ncbi:HNH endonuclease [Aeromonas rivipollensis]|uniref:HNH endonuclease n=1 Tax=Aeromonas rivipollensis TaxID=948519 RepID=UPI0026EC59BC|nr:HNH endonuclease [Aeromonas media]
MKNRIGHCSYCGAEHVNQYIEHILPLSLSGTNSDDNLIMICADCHRKLDSRSFTEIEFNHYLSQLMQATTKFVDIKLEEKISQDAPYRADITAKDKSGKSWLIECKRAQSFIPVNFNKAVQQVETYKKVSSFDNYVLAFPGLISESQKVRKSER